MILPFWRPMNEQEAKLLELLAEAHYASAMRANGSREALLLAAAGSGEYTKGLVAALSTIGGVHGPLVQTYNLLVDIDPVGEAAGMVLGRRKVPGWGNSFVRGEHDPLWHRVETALRDVNPELRRVIVDITKQLHFHGKFVFPNPSAYTAATAIAVGLPRELTPYLFVAPRLHAWTAHLFQQQDQWIGLAP